MPDVDYEDLLADLVRRMVTPSAGRGSLDYADWVGDDDA